MTHLVSIVTPTFPGREEELLNRCIPSVLSQTWRDIQHVIVSDRNPSLEETVRGLADWARKTYPRIDPLDITTKRRRLDFVQINESWRNPVSENSVGAIPWYVGSLLAMGTYVGFLGDDDEYLPDHVMRHLEVMGAADFSISQVEFRVDNVPQFLVGNDTFAHGHLDSDGIMCKANSLQRANWSISTENGMAGDWRLVRDWMSEGLTGVFVGEGPTAIHHDGWVVQKTGRPDRPR